MEFKLKKGSKSLLYLTACALNSRKANLSLISDENMNRIFAISHFQGLTALVAKAVTSSDLFKERLTKEYGDLFKDAINASIKRRALMDNERNIIIDFFEKNAIWYCPLKGIILQDLYPAYEMREMADNDLLVDPEKMADIRAFMLDRSYELDDTVSHHDEFTKAPLYNFEFHKKLFRSIANETLSAYYEDIKKKLIKDEDNNYGYHMSNEDCYIYVIAHAYKHFEQAAAGLKTLTDIWVMNKKWGKTLDRDYIENELKKLNIFSFEKACKNIASTIFDYPSQALIRISELNKEEREILSKLSKIGLFGSHEDHIQSSLSKLSTDKNIVGRKAKLKYYMKRLFPDDNYYKEAHPFFHKYPLLKPAFLAQRFVTKGLGNIGNMSKEIIIVEKTKKKK